VSVGDEPTRRTCWTRGRRDSLESSAPLSAPGATRTPVAGAGSRAILPTTPTAVASLHAGPRRDHGLRQRLPDGRRPGWRSAEDSAEL